MVTVSLVQGSLTRSTANRTEELLDLICNRSTTSFGMRGVSAEGHVLSPVTTASRQRQPPTYFFHPLLLSAVYAYDQKVVTICWFDTDIH